MVNTFGFRRERVEVNITRRCTHGLRKLMPFLSKVFTLGEKSDLNPYKALGGKRQYKKCVHLPCEQ